MHTKLILGLYIVKAGSLFKYSDQFTNLCHSQMAILICVQICYDNMGIVHVVCMANK